MRTAVAIVIKIRHLVAAMLASFAAGAKYGFTALDAMWNILIEAFVRIVRMLGH